MNEILRHAQDDELEIQGFLDTSFHSPRILSSRSLSIKASSFVRFWHSRLDSIISFSKFSNSCSPSSVILTSTALLSCVFCVLDTNPLLSKRSIKREISGVLLIIRPFIKLFDAERGYCPL